MGQPSQTAQRTAFARAWESDRPDGTRVCYDPVAKHLLSDEGRFFLNTVEGRKQFEKTYANPVWDTFLDYVALRTKVADSFVLQAAGDGIRQLLILGAGYDTKALRLEELRQKIKVFEVDQPETQEDKKAKLIAQYGSLPEHIVYVPVDFEKDDLSGSLQKAGFDSASKTLATWEGVACYLEPEAVDRTLAALKALLPAGSGLFFDYAFPEVIDGSTQNPLMQALGQMAADLGEPLKFGLEPDAVEEFLAQRGFCEVVNHSIEQCKKRVLTPAHGERNPFTEFNLVQAKVAP